MHGAIHVSTRKGLFTLRRHGTGACPWRIGEASFLGDNVMLVGHDPRDGALLTALHHGHFGDKLHASADGGSEWAERPAPAFPPKPEGAADVMCPMRNVPIPWNVEQIWALAPGGPDQPGRWWCGTIPGALFRSDDGGKSWALNEPLWSVPERSQWFGGGYDWPGIHSISVDPRDSRHVTLGVSCGGVWETRDDGASWRCCADGMFAEYMPPEQRHNPAIQDPHLVARCAAQPDVLWAQHHNGIFRTIDDCRTWKAVSNAAVSGFGFAVAVHPRDGETAWFVPAIKDEKRIPVDGRFVVTRTRDGGRTFETLRRGLPPEHAYHLVFRHALDVDASGTLLAMGSTTGGVWVSEDAGDTWLEVSQHLPPVHAVRIAPG